MTRAQRNAGVAKEVKDLLVSHNMWVDVAIYFNGGCISPQNEGAVADKGSVYFEYANDETVCMSFEGPLYSAIHYHHNHPVYSELEAIFDKYGYYHEFGHAWNLSLHDK